MEKKLQIFHLTGQIMIFWFICIFISHLKIYIVQSWKIFWPRKPKNNPNMISAAFSSIFSWKGSLLNPLRTIVDSFCNFFNLRYFNESLTLPNAFLKDGIFGNKEDDFFGFLDFKIFFEIFLDILFCEIFSLSLDLTVNREAWSKFFRT